MHVPRFSGGPVGRLPHSDARAPVRRSTRFAFALACVSSLRLRPARSSHSSLPSRSSPSPSDGSRHGGSVRPDLPLGGAISVDSRSTRDRAVTFAGPAPLRADRTPVRRSSPDSNPSPIRMTLSESMPDNGRISGGEQPDRRPPRLQDGYMNRAATATQIARNFV